MELIFMCGPFLKGLTCGHTQGWPHVGWCHVVLLSFYQHLLWSAVHYPNKIVVGVRGLRPPPINVGSVGFFQLQSAPSLFLYMSLNA